MFLDGKSKRNRILSVLTAGVTATAVIAGAIYLNGSEVNAANVTLRGIETLANEHSEGLNPFVIIEVVPDMSKARLGYLVGGEEPVDNGRSIKDMPSKDERLAKLAATTPDPDPMGTGLEGENNAYTWETYAEPPADEAENVKSMEIRGTFAETAGAGHYSRHDSINNPEDYLRYPNETTSFDDTIREQANNEGVTLYRKMARFDLGGSGYKLTFTEMTEDDLPIEVLGEYNRQYFKFIPKYDNAFEEGDIIFQGNSSHIEFFKKVNAVVLENKLDGEGQPVFELDENDERIPTYDEDGNLTGYKIEQISVLKDEGGNEIIFEPGMTYGYIRETSQSAFTIGGGDGVFRIDPDTAEESTGAAAVFGRSLDYYQIDGTPGSYTADDCPNEKDYYTKGDTEYNEYDYISTGDGDYEFTTDYAQTVYETFSYTGGFDNHEWFKRYVFDRNSRAEYDALSIDVIPVTIDELDEDDHIGKADLIYFANGSYVTDISADTAVSLINRVAASELPVMMEYSAYTDNEGKPNLNKMMLELMQSKVESIANEDAFNALEGEALKESVHKYDSTSDTIIAAKEADPNRDISYAYERVFVNDDTDTVSSGTIVDANFHDTFSEDKVNNGFKAVRSEIDEELKYIELTVEESVAKTFNKEISKATAIRYILNNSKSRISVKNKLKILDIEPYQSDQFDFTEGRKGTSYNDLNYQMMKSGASQDDNIAFFEYRDIMTVEWVKSNLSFTGNDEDISIRQMGTKELVGINDDLNSDYDLIYIGADTALIPTDNVRDTNGNEVTKKNAQNQDCKIKGYASTLHNDSSLDGLIYTHVGDRFDNYSDYYGERLTYSNYASGNDITKDKLRELKNYIQAGYAVIISDTFVTKDGKVNTARVDQSSNMYKLIAWLVENKDTGDDKGGGSKYYGKNVQLKSDLEEVRSNPMYDSSANPDYDNYRKTIATYLNIAKLELIVNSKPVAYDGGTYLTMSSDGNYYLSFNVELKNDSSIDTSERATYDCKLYIDMDADGKYEDVESLGGLMINNGSDIESDGHFHLTAGNTYDISRAVPSDYVGFLAWKLEFSQNEREGDAFDSNAVRSSVIGYSAVPVSGEKPTIHVLQIVPNVTNSNIHWGGTEYNTYNFSDGEESYSDYTYLNLYDSKMQELYKKVQDFNIDIDQITVQNYILRYHWPKVEGTGYFSGSYYEFLSQYDMVVMGFTDGFSFAADRDVNGGGYNMGGNENTGLPDPNNPAAQMWKPRREIYREALLGVREYTMSGRSILFTHDLTSHAAYENRQGYFYNMYLRDVMGLDRYGQLATSYRNNTTYFDYSYDSTNKIPEYVSEYDSPTLNGSTISEQKAFSDHNIIRFTANKNYGLLSRWHTRGSGAFSGETVTQINSGQITQYPYKITDEDAKSFAVNETHAQYFQLNLDTDSTDSNVDDDVVVWYVLSNTGSNTSDGDHQYYKEVQMDARNNYYIYTKGNVTYTGAGHRPVNDKERELFVNTLVAAYNSGLHAPRVTYKENPWETSASIAATYLPYDPELIDSELDTAEGGFLDTTLTVNFKTMNNNFRTSTEYLNTAYYVEVESGGDLVLNGKSYKRIVPTDFYIVDAAGNRVREDNYSLLLNYRIYQATFDISGLTISNGSGKINNDDVKLYVRIGLEDLVDGDVGSEPATESMNPLGIYATRLFNLE